MGRTKPELVGVPRATGVALYVPSGRRHYAPRGVTRRPEGKPGAALSPSRLSGARWPAPLSARTALQTDGDEDVGRSIRQRGFPEEEVRLPGPMRREKRSRRDGAPPTVVGWCQGVRGQLAWCSPPHGRPAQLLGEGWTRDSCAALAQSLGGARAHPLARKAPRREAPSVSLALGIRLTRLRTPHPALPTAFVPLRQASTPQHHARRLHLST